ncbi:MAG: chromate efflux transporter [Bacteroidota bacterium]|nr:chromate efflux transporter [Bacteroidota bacterium]
MDKSGAKIIELRKLAFLKQVFWLSLTAFGGPQVHFTRFTDVLVKKRRFLSNEELLEINSFCQMLPGPTSTQTITTIGYRRGGPVFAAVTLAIWALPSCILMGLLAFIVSMCGNNINVGKALQYIPAMAVGFMCFAAIRFTQQMVKSKVHAFILLFTALVPIIYSHPIFIPILLVLGGFITNFTTGKTLVKPQDSFANIRWGNLWVFIGVWVIAALLGNLLHNRPALLFENTYRYGSLVFGGGNVLVPMMYDQFVLFKEYMDHQTFMTGVGMSQALPGPVFSISSYANGMALSGMGGWGLLLGCAIGSIAIFLPGLLLIFFFHPIWYRLKTYNRVQKAIEGINAASAGLVVAAAVLLMRPVHWDWGNAGIIVLTVAYLWWGKWPSPILVLAVLIFGMFAG